MSSLPTHDPRYAWVSQVQDMDWSGVDIKDGEQVLNALHTNNAMAQNTSSEPVSDVSLAAGVMHHVLRKHPAHSGWLNNYAFQQQRIYEAIEGELQPTSPPSPSQTPTDGQVEPPSLKLPQLFVDRDEVRFEQGWEVITEGLVQAQKDRSQKDYFIEGDIPEITKSLFPFQREGVGRLEYLEWKYQGSILGDEMGLGKTLETITLIARAKARGEMGTTLIIMSPALLPQWAEELLAAPSLKFHVYDEVPDVPVLFKDYDVILTTWDRIAREWKRLDDVFEDWKLLHNGATVKSSSGKTVPIPTDRISAPFFAHKWKRICLDEAHRIRNITKQRYRSVCALRADFRMCISGTPLQNDYHDFYALLSFLKITPFDNKLFFDRCFVHKSKEHKKATSALLKRNLEACMASVRRAICLRRNKDDIFLGERLLGARPETTKSWVAFDLEADSQAMQEEYRHIWDPKERERRTKAIKNGEKVSELPDRNMFEALIRMRLACCHPRLIEAQYGNHSVEGDGGPVSDAQEVKSGHISDSTLAKQMRKADEQVDAEDMDPTTKKAAALNEDRRKQFIAEMTLADAWKSSKVCTTIEEIKKALVAQETYAATLSTQLEQREAMSRGKVIVFSSFLSASDMVALGLKKEGIPFYEINGQVTQPNRKKVLRAFEELDDQGKPRDLNVVAPDPTRVLLASLQIAGEGLNVVHASRIFFLAAVWNPFLELQAMARADRVGQKQEVVVKYIHAKESIEDRIKAIGKEKHAKVKGITCDSNVRKDVDILRGMTLASFTDVVTQKNEDIDPDIAAEEPVGSDSDEGIEINDDDDPDGEYVPDR